VPTYFANIITGLTQPIFNQRQVRTKFEVAKANQGKAYLQFEQSLLTAGKEVSDAHQYNEPQNHHSLETRCRCEKAVNYSEELLTYGMANYLEVLF
jgi:outer membrane protein TolC